MPTADSPFTRQSWFSVYADGTALEPFAVVAFSGVQTRGSARIAKVVNADDASPRPPLYYALMGPSPVASGGYGMATLAMGSPWWAAYASGDGTPAVGEEWGPISTYVLRKNAPGFMIVGGAESDRVLVVQRAITNLIGKPTAAIANAASGTVTVWTGAAGSEATAGYTITAYNRSGQKVPQDKFCTLTRVDGQWYVTGKSGSNAAWIRFTLPSALTTSQASKASCTVDDYWGGDDPGATVTVYNPDASSNYIFAGPNGGKGLATWDDIDEKYWILNLECP